MLLHFVHFCEKAIILWFVSMFWLASSALQLWNSSAFSPLSRKKEKAKQRNFTNNHAHYESMWIWTPLEWCMQTWVLSMTLAGWCTQIQLTISYLKGLFQVLGIISWVMAVSKIRKGLFYNNYRASQWVSFEPWTQCCICFWAQSTLTLMEKATIGICLRAS